MLFAQAGGEAWLIPVVGLLATCLIALLGMRLINRNKNKSNAKTALARGKWKGLERRACPRAHARRVKLLVRDRSEGNEPETGLILDRSLGGLAVELKEKVAVGQRLQLRLPEWAPEASWVTVEVCYCRPLDGTWRIGCRFLDMSSWEVINTFGPPDPDEP